MRVVACICRQTSDSCLVSLFLLLQTAILQTNLTRMITTLGQGQ